MVVVACENLDFSFMLLFSLVLGAFTNDSLLSYRLMIKPAILEMAEISRNFCKTKNQA